jgi:hypothetical protein
MDDQNSGLGEAPPVNRFLVFAVYFMGAVLVLLVLGLIGGIIYKIKNRVVVPEGTGWWSSACPHHHRCARPYSRRQAHDQHGHGSFIVEVSTRKVLLRVKAISP